MIFKDFVDPDKRDSVGVVHSYSSSMTVWRGATNDPTWTPGQPGVLRLSLGHANSIAGPGKPSDGLPGQKYKITKN